MKLKSLLIVILLSSFYSGLYSQKLEIVNNISNKYVHLWVYANKDKKSFMKYIILNPRTKGNNNKFTLPYIEPKSRIAYYISKTKNEIQMSPHIKYIPISQARNNSIPNSTSVIVIDKDFFGKPKFSTSYVISNK